MKAKNGRLKKLIAIFFLSASVLLITLQIIKDFSNKDYWAKSGFEKNQALMREEFYRREIPRVYFRKVGYFYLTTARFTINRVDREFAKVLDINLNPVIVWALVLGVLLL